DGAQPQPHEVDRMDQAVLAAAQPRAVDLELETPGSQGARQPFAIERRPAELQFGNARRPPADPGAGGQTQNPPARPNPARPHHAPLIACPGSAGRPPSAPASTASRIPGLGDWRPASAVWPSSARRPAPIWGTRKPRYPRPP